jgi:hypothetical protein
MGLTMRNFACIACCAALALTAPAFAQTYRDVSGTMVPGVVPMVGCPSGGGQCAAPVGNSNPLPQKQGALTPLGYCQLSVTSAVQTSACSGGIPAGAVYALICNEGIAARWRDDGAAPTASVGNILGTGTATAPICSAFYTMFSTLEWIAESGTSTLDITFYK